MTTHRSIREIEAGINSIDKIFHIADVHIRNLKRHDEYRSVFDKTYQYLRENKTDDSIICLLGDLVHSKTEISPELVELLATFLIECANIMPTLLIPGNHDALLNNPSRLDALTPIVNSIQHDNLWYLKENGLYALGDTCFSHFSVFTKPEEYIMASEIPDSYSTKIALYHGLVDQATTEFNFILKNTDVTIDKFHGFDIGLLGDIHKRQSMDLLDNVKYCGSLIQQNFGEELNHGFLEWDVPQRKSKFVQIPNDWGFYTMVINHGVVPVNKQVPNKVRLRLKFMNTSDEEVKNVIEDVRRIYNVQRLTTTRVDGNEQPESRSGSIVDVGNIRNRTYQNELILDYVKRHNQDVEDEILEKVRSINEKTNAKLDESKLASDIKWKPIRFEFDNMFSYGEGNVVDFTDLDGVVGIFGPNASGKSSLLDAICFTLFDKSPRAYKITDIINNKAKSYRCKFVFEIEGVEYTIERSGEYTHDGRLPVDTNFYKTEIDEKGEWHEISLNGEQRWYTDKIIKKYVGEYEDFLLTTMSVQNDNTIFIEKTMAERKDLLAQFIGLDVFDKLYNIANEDSRDTKSLVKEANKRDLSEELVEAENERKEKEATLSILEKKKKKYEKQRRAILDEIIKLNQQIYDVPDIPTNKDQIIDRLEKVESELDESREKLSAVSIKKKEKEHVMLNVKGYLNMFDIDHVKSKSEQANGVSDALQKMQSKHRSLNNSLESVQENINHIENHKEFDPDCEYCVNRHESDAKALQEYKDQKQTLEREIKTLESSIKGAKNKLGELESYPHKLKEIQKFQNKLNDVESEIQSYELEISRLETNIEKSKQKLRTTEDELDTFEQVKEKIKGNESIQKQIKNLRRKESQSDAIIEDLNRKIKKIHSKVSVLKSEEASIKKLGAKKKKLREEYAAYELYLDAVKRDGVPYEIISESIPCIESEVNDILSQMVDFKIALTVDGKNINASIVYGEDKFWPLELASGMEKFVSSLAIRTSLINISSLPRPNFIAIDEGFGNLDTENINSISLLFSYLRNTFDFVMVISHLDIMRDIAQTDLQIEQSNGFSYLNNLD